MAGMVSEINPQCEVYAQQVFLSPETLANTLDSFPRPDYVVDCIDTVAQKLAIAHWCASWRIPLLASMGAANKIDPTSLRFADIDATFNCRLSKVIRKGARRRGLKGIEVIFSTELPRVITPAGLDSQGAEPQRITKAESLGSMSYMPPLMGQMLAGKVISRLSGLEAMKRPPRLIRRLPESPS